VQRLARQYPPGWYRIKEGAPYGISYPGTIVKLYSYVESGDVGVIVFTQRKRPEAIEHERMLAKMHGTPPVHGKDILVRIDPS
jgi:hypothetical protein